MDAATEFLARELHARYGNVTRARGAFLYTEKGVRLTDLYRENGRAILGWGGGSAFTQLKNVLSRGITGSYATAAGPRLERAMSDLLASPRKSYFFASRASALEAALSVSPQDTSCYLPWAPGSPDWAARECVVVEPPLPWAQGVFVLAVKDTVQNELALAHVQGSFATVRIPAPIAAACARAVYDLMQEVRVRAEKDWFIYDKPLTRWWERRGPYLYVRPEAVPKERHAQFVLHCLDCGVVIHPVHGRPSIVPFGADRGVFSALEKSVF